MYSMVSLCYSLILCFTLNPPLDGNLAFRINGGFSREELEDMMELYKMSDEDGSGEICTLELGSIFRALGYKANMEQLTSPSVLLSIH